jgi:hypothetical protein
MQLHDLDVKPVRNNELILFFVSIQVNKLKLVSQGNRAGQYTNKSRTKVSRNTPVACHSAPNRCGSRARTTLQPSKSVVAQELQCNH